MDIKQRVKNMVWNVGGYDLDVAFGGDSSTDTKSVTIQNADVFVRAGVSEEDAQKMVMYAAAHEGAHTIHSDIEALRNFLKQSKEEGYDLEKINSLVQIAEDYRVDMTATKERPGYNDLRTESIQGTIKMFGGRVAKKELDNTTKAISAMTYGINMADISKEWDKAVDWDLVNKASREIMDNATKYDNGKEMMEDFVKPLYDNLWGKPDRHEDSEDEESKDKEKSEESGEDGEGGSDESNPEERSEENEEDESKDSDDGEDGESLTTDQEIEKLIEDSKDVLDKFVDEKGRDRLDYEKEYEKINEDSKKRNEKSKEEMERWYKEKYPSIWSEQEEKEVGRTLCKDIHAGTTIRYEKNTYPTHVARDKAKLDDQARKLSHKLKEIMASAKRADSYMSDNGNISASKAYRAPIIGDARVFSKSTYDEEGDYVVDLLLDASGSQSYREDSIRKQAYILTRALSLAGIPCRVTQFSVSRHITRIVLFRDYDDNMKKDINVTAFSAGGDNRDALAILGAYHELKKRRETNKIFIVLSDGQPSDTSGGSVVENAGGLAYYTPKREWRGRTVLEDLTTTIRKIRSDGVALMGIYVGNKGQLESEKAMFGKDFAYIGEDMDNFVPVVGKFLEKQILGFDK